MITKMFNYALDARTESDVQFEEINWTGYEAVGLSVVDDIHEALGLQLIEADLYASKDKQDAEIYNIDEKTFVVCHSYEFYGWRKKWQVFTEYQPTQRRELSIANPNDETDWHDEYYWIFDNPTSEAFRQFCLMSYDKYDNLVLIASNR